MAKMIKCATCGADIASNAKSCPNCGAKNKKPVYRRPIFIILLVIVILFGVRSFNVARQHNSYVEKGYAILKFDDGTEMRSWDLNKIEDESSVKATTYVGKEVNTTIQITNISPHFIEDGVGCIVHHHFERQAFVSLLVSAILNGLFHHAESGLTFDHFNQCRILVRSGVACLFQRGLGSNDSAVGEIISEQILHGKTFLVLLAPCVFLGRHR